MQIKLIFTFFGILLLVNHAFGQKLNSTFGGPFTPAGDLRFLVIFAGYESDCNKSSPMYNEGTWPEEDPSQQFAPCKTFHSEYKNLFYQDYSQFSDTANDKTLSNFFYQMSRKNPARKPLRVVADFFPERINISGHSPNNYEVFQKIQTRYPDFDWKKYDRRKNNPNFQFDNETSGPDGKLDFVVVIYRGKGINGAATLYTNFNFTTTVSGQQETFRADINCGFTMINSIWHLQGVRNLFLHELSHTLFNCPHFFYANKVLGDYFYSSSGWGLMAYGELNSSANAWESWYMGWIELPENRDLKSVGDNGIYTLRDFVTTGDAMRLKIPGTYQHLWLENHSGQSVFDERDGWKTDGNGLPIPSVSKGLYAIVENVSADRTKIIQPLSGEYCNGLKVISATGNYDYGISDEIPDSHFWNNYTADFTQRSENPSSQHNDMALIRANFSYDTNYRDIIFHRNFTNHAGEPLVICDKHYTRQSHNEGMKIARTNGNYTYNSLGTTFAFSEPGQKMGLGSNPMIVNLQKYNICDQTLESVILHGLSVEILKNDTIAGEMTIKVRFDDVAIKRNYRLSGNLKLVSSEENNEHLVLDKNVTLRINKSGTANRHYRTSTNDTIVKYPDFVTPSLLFLDSGSVFRMRKRSTLKIEEGTTLYIRKGAKVYLESGAEIVIRPGSYIAIEPGAELMGNDPNLIKMKKGAVKGINPLLKPFKAVNETIDFEKVK